MGYRPNLNGGALDDRYYDGADMVLQFRRLNAGNQWVRFVYGPGADQPLAMEVYPVAAAPTPGSGQVFYYHADGEGSIRLLTDANAQVANRYDYDSFGKPLTVVEAVAQPYTWKAREYIAGVGLYYNRARFYDPQMGRFTTEDPLGYGGGSANLYAFGFSNPKKWNDPSGLSEEGFLASNSSKVSAGFGLAGLALACLFTDVGAILHSALEFIPSDVAAIAGNAICGASAKNAGGKGGKNGVASGGGKGFGAKSVTIGAKIDKVLARRGWTKNAIDDAVANPVRTVATRDTRNLPGGGRMDDPATAYYYIDGGYVVINDRTGDVVQISNRTDPGWKTPWD